MVSLYTRAMNALRSDDLATLRSCLSQGLDANTHPSHTISLLHRAVLTGRSSIVALLLKHGANPNAGDNESCTPLHYAAEVDSKSLIDRLVRYGAVVDAADHYGNTALHRAAALGKERAVSALIAAGATPTLTNTVGQTAGDLMRESAEKVRLLNPHRVKNAGRMQGRDTHGRE